MRKIIIIAGAMFFIFNATLLFGQDFMQDNQGRQNISSVPVENEDGSYDMSQPTGIDLRNPEPQVKPNQLTKESLQKLAGNWVPKRLNK